jgi:hypothetical protein
MKDGEILESQSVIYIYIYKGGKIKAKMCRDGEQCHVWRTGAEKECERSSKVRGLYVSPKTIFSPPPLLR